MASSSSSSSSANKSSLRAGASDELRSILRQSAAAEPAAKTASALLTSLLLTNGASSNTELSRDRFCEALNTIKGVRQRFTPDDLVELFGEAVQSIGTVKVTAGAVIDFYSAAMSKARAWSIKMRSAIMQDYDGPEKYKRAFSSMATGAKTIVELNAFTDFAEDMLELDENTISEADSKALYAIFDVDGDGEVSLNDFLAFMLGQTVEAIRQLESGNGEVIVDIKISTGAEKEAELKRNGYTQVLPAASALAGIDPATFGSFGRGNGIWIWKRRQGTCSGRLKPIIDIQLDASATSSSSVLIGYSCIPLSVAGQFVWIKRASTEEEEKDAIVDLRVTIGKMKNIADKIWTNPGMYVLVSQSGTGQSGNFNRGMFSSTDAFLWFRPMRTRTTESAMVSVISSLSQLSEESKKVRLLAAARNAIRHFVPLSEVKRLANLQMESSEAESKLQLRSERLFDYSSLFHQYGNSTKGILSRRNFAKMMVDIGMNMDPQDLTRCYNYFDKDLNGKLSRVEFANVVALTDHEIDCIVDKIRARLLVSGGSSGKAGGGASSLQSQPGIINPKAAAAAAAAQAKPRNEFRESRILSHIFRHVNVNNDCILSLDEVLDLTARLEIFLTEAEARRIARDMDVDMDDRIEEADFITFMKRPSEVVSKKAGRLHAATFQLRKWLIGGSNAKGSTNVLATEMQWNDLKSRHERSTLRKFPGYLTSEDLLMVLSAQSVLLSGAEARELLLLVAPEGNGQVRQPDLHAFMNRQCRSLGELVALLERDVMNSIVEVYRTHRAAIRTDGVADSELSDRFQAQVLEYVKRIQTSQASRDGAARSGSTVHDVVSVAQLKAGIEASMGRAPLNGASAMPNLEEYACLGSLVGASVADEDTFGINARAFVEGICNYIVRDKASGSTETVSLEAMCRNLRKMIREEAKAAGGGRNYDYVATFASFDEDGGGTISLNEFRKMLTRLQLLTKLPEKQVPKLLAMFDRGAKGFVTFDDFLSFVELAKDDDDDDHALDDDEADDETLGLSSNTPPASITRNADCDWLLWFLWRQSCRIAPRDPENAIAELGSACDAAEKRGSSGAAVMTVKAFWSLLVDKKLCGSMTRAQFDKGIKFVVHDGTGRDDDGLDHESLCNYVVKMGRAFNGLLQQRRTVDEKKFVQLRASLIKELLEIDASSLAAAAAGEEDAIVSPGQSIGSRFERVLRRLDTNSDGLLTVPEFKLALKRLKIRDEKRWSAAMVRRLFDESSVRVDGMLHIGEFGKSVRGELDASRAAGRPNELSDDEDDDVFALPKAATTDSALYRKTSEILLELVPMTSSSYSPGAVSAHCDAVRATIRHFFQKSDPDASGAVDEDTFRLFCRKSGLQSRLRVAELRKLCSKLRRRGGDSRDGRPGRDAQIDYEKLCKLVGPGAESQPRSRVDALMQRLQEAAAQSEQAGRSFLALCTLTDPRLTGRVSNEEFAIVAKMLGCPMTLPEVDIIKEQLADIDVENLEASRGNANHGRRGRDGDDEREFTRGGASGVDYRKVNHLIETYQSSTRPSPSPYGDVDPYGVTGTMRNTRSLGALPSYAVSSVTRMPSTGVPRLDISRVLPTPGGLFLATPQGVGTPLRASMGASLPRDMGRSGGLGASAGLSASMGFGMGMGSSGVNLGTLGRSSGAGLGATVYDRSLALMADKVVAACARQARGTSPFIHLRRRLETADRGHVGLATEEAVQVVLEDLGVSLSAPDLYLIRTRFGNTAGSVDYEALVQALSESAGAAARSGAGAGAGGVFSAGVGRRLRELVREGVELRRVFADYDFDGLGVIEVRHFVDVVKRLALLQTERQLLLAIDSFASHADKSLVSYADFCAAADAAERQLRAVEDQGYGTGGGAASGRWVYGSDFDGLGARRDGEWDEGSDLDLRKTSGRPPLARGYSSGGLSPPRMSASVASSQQWGNNTPLHRKGLPLEIADAWACSVCLYVENPLESTKCLVCDSADVSKKQSRHASRDTCKNCRFQNDGMATVCDMCGLRLN